jgi:hypothetical protein
VRVSARIHHGRLDFLRDRLGVQVCGRSPANLSRGRKRESERERERGEEGMPVGRPRRALNPSGASSSAVGSRGHRHISAGLRTICLAINYQSLQACGWCSALSNSERGCRSAGACSRADALPQGYPGGNPGVNLKSISLRCHPILVAFVWELT